MCDSITHLNNSSNNTGESIFYYNHEIQSRVLIMCLMTKSYVLILIIWQLVDESLPRLTRPGNHNAALQFSHREMQSCKRNSDCPHRTFCKLPYGDCIKKRKRELKGHCVEYNFFCTRIYRPVCGCNGRAYSNACVCHSKGINIAREGRC